MLPWKKIHKMFGYSASTLIDMDKRLFGHNYIRSLNSIYSLWSLNSLNKFVLCLHVCYSSRTQSSITVTREEPLIILMDFTSSC